MILNTLVKKIYFIKIILLDYARANNIVIHTFKHNSFITLALLTISQSSQLYFIVLHICIDTHKCKQTHTHAIAITILYYVI